MIDDVPVESLAAAFIARVQMHGAGARGNARDGVTRKLIGEHGHGPVVSFRPRPVQSRLQQHAPNLSEPAVTADRLSPSPERFDVCGAAPDMSTWDAIMLRRCW